MNNVCVLNSAYPSASLNTKEEKNILAVFMTTNDLPIKNSFYCDKISSMVFDAEFDKNFHSYFLSHKETRENEPRGKAGMSWRYGLYKSHIVSQLSGSWGLDPMCRWCYCNHGGFMI